MSSTIAILKSKESTKKWEFYRGFSPSSTSSKSLNERSIYTDSQKRHFSSNDSLFYMFSLYDKDKSSIL